MQQPYPLLASAAAIHTKTHVDVWQVGQLGVDIACDAYAQLNLLTLLTCLSCVALAFI